MHVYCELFDVLDFTERNEDLSTIEAHTSPFCQRQVAYMKSPTYFVYACVESIAMLKQLYPYPSCV